MLLFITDTCLAVDETELMYVFVRYKEKNNLKYFSPPPIHMSVK